MTTAAQYLLAKLAAKMSLTAAQAVALPETITIAARKVSMTEAGLIAECFYNEPLAAYLASICREVA